MPISEIWPYGALCESTVNVVATFECLGSVESCYIVIATQYMVIQS